MKKLTRIELPTKFGMKTVNSYLIKGDEVVIIDCGEDTDASYYALKAGLKDKQLEISDIDRVIITHAHVDHMGMANRVARAADCTVWTSEIVHDWAVDPNNKWNTRETLMKPTLMDYFNNETKTMISGGYDQVMGDMTKVWNPIEPDRLRNFDSEGNIEMDGYVWNTLYMPGHSNTQSTFYNSSTKEYISADMLLRITPTPVVEPMLKDQKKREIGILRMIESYERLLKMDINIVHPGHYDIFDNAHIVIEQQMMRIRQRSEECYKIIEAGTHTFIDIFNVLYKGRFHMPALIMLIGYLDLLENDGRIKQVKDDEGVIKIFLR